MADKNISRHTNPEKRITWQPSRFINQELTADQKRKLKEADFGVVEFESGMARLLDSGYKVTVSVDSKYSCYGAFAIPTDDKSVNKGYILAARGSTPFKAVKQLLFKHFTIFDGHSWDLGNNWGSEDIDD